MANQKVVPISITGYPELAEALSAAASQQRPRVSRSNLGGWIIEEWLLENAPTIAKKHGIKPGRKAS